MSNKVHEFISAFKLYDSGPNIYGNSHFVGKILFDKTKASLFLIAMTLLQQQRPLVTNVIIAFGYFETPNKASHTF